MVTVRYDNKVNFLFRPFATGVRHLKVAFCDGKKETLSTMASEKIIHKEGHEDLSRISHFAWGFFETLGYLAAPAVLLCLYKTTKKYPKYAPKHSLWLIPFIIFWTDRAIGNARILSYQNRRV